MPTPRAQLLTTKLYAPPPRPALVTRPRLTDKLDAALKLQHKLILISAPAGFGKTTIISEWLQQERGGRRVEGGARPSTLLPPLSTSWLSLDADDNDPARFLTYFIAAMAKLDPGLESLFDLIQLLQTPTLPPAETILLQILNTFAEQIPTAQCLVVLDDFHVVERAELHNALAFFLQHAPPNLLLAITTRTDPALPLARLRARGQLTELRASDLRFTSAEVAAFLKQLMNLQLTAQQIKQLESRTEGWIAGLQLAALSMQNGGDIENFLRAFTGSHHYIVDYLVEEVLQNQSVERQHFLLQTSILERMNGALCDAVTGGSNGQATLEQLERANLFVTPLDAARNWYRYHHLFSELLRHRFQAQFKPAEQFLYHTRASDWFEQNGLEREAIQHALLAQDYVHAATLLERITDTILNQGETATLQGWMDALPETVLRASPRLCLARANAHVIVGEIDSAETWIRAAESSAQSSPERVLLLSKVDALRAGLALYRNDLPRTIELAQRALKTLPIEEVRLRGAVMFYLGLAYGFSDHIAEAYATFTASAREAFQASDWHTALIALQNQAWVLFLQGKLRQAAQMYNQALTLAVERGVAQVPAVGGFHWELGRVLYEWNDLAEAERKIEIGIENSTRGNLPRMLLFSCVNMARLRLAQKNFAAADELLTRAQSLVEKYNLSLRYAGTVTAERVRYWMAIHDYASANAWLQTMNTGDDMPRDYLHEVLHLAIARVLLAQNETASALDRLELLKQTALEVGRNGTAIEGLILQALAFQQQGAPNDALRALEHALTLGEPEGYTRSFLDEGEAMQKLLAQLHAQLIHRVQSEEVARRAAYCERLLNSFPPATSTAASAIPQRAARPFAATLAEPLTERELQVLRLLAQGYTNQQISNALFISIGTTKKHLNNIFGKLSATSRTQALLRARELGLLE